MALLKSCCCRLISLKTGSIIIGKFGLVSLILFYVVFRIQDSVDLSKDKLMSSIHFYSPKFIIFWTLLLLMLTTASIFLIIGAYKGYKVFLLPWILSFSLFITFFTAYMIFVMVRLSGLILGGAMFILAVFFVYALAVEVYLLAIVISLFQELNKYQTEEGNNAGKIFSGPNYWSPGGVYVVSYTSGNEAA